LQQYVEGVRFSYIEANYYTRPTLALHQQKVGGKCIGESFFSTSQGSIKRRRDDGQARAVSSAGGTTGSFLSSELHIMSMLPTKKSPTTQEDKGVKGKRANSERISPAMLITW
jgi:hypothetical protein